MSNYEIEQGIENLLKLIIGMQVILIIAFVLQFIANLTIIIQLPKIKKYTKKIYENTYNDNYEIYVTENEDNTN